MKINKVILENFLCYYGKSEFQFTDGLNLILGRNGEGKTKFFEALEWIFSSTDKDSLKLVSAKRLKELTSKKDFSVRVSVTIEKDKVLYRLEKSFLVSLSQDKPYSLNYQFFASEDREDGSRIKVEGEKMLERLFPASIRRYCLFKGESELRIFDQEETLKNLIDTFSEVKYYPPYIDLICKMNKWYEDAMEKTAKSNEKISKEVRNIQSEIDELKKEEDRYKKLLKEATTELEKASSELSKVETNATRSEALSITKERIKTKQDEINKIKHLIDESYSRFILDDKWVLFNFEDIYEKFNDKLAELRKEKNEQEKKYLKEKAKEAAKLELIAEVTPLPWFIPDEGTMKELLKDEICKVCNRPAKNGTEAYKFMELKLQEFINQRKKSEKKEPIEDSSLFMNSYIDNMLKFEIALNASGIELEGLKNNISERLEFNRARKDDLKRLQDELDAEIEEKNRLLAESNTSEYYLTNMYGNIIEWTNIVKENSSLKGEYERLLSTIREQISEKTETRNRKNAQVLPSYQIETFNILQDIQTVFSNTKERLLNEFVDKLEKTSNYFISKINVDDFTGQIKLRRSTDRISVHLVTNDGTLVHKPYKSLEISKNMAVLFGISKLTSETKEEDFPMIFDAPTSDFDIEKTADFYNVIYEDTKETGKQRIICTFNFTKKDDNGLPCVDTESFNKVKSSNTYWICKERPFDQNDLGTINTIVKKYE